MNNIDIFKKKILYLSQHRGIKEMDLLLGNFVKKYIKVHQQVNIGEVAERLKALVLKTSDGATHSWVRIPPSPPYLYFESF